MRETHTVFRAGAAPARPGTQGTRAGYPELDRFRLVAALLVVAIHTSPLLSLGETADFLLTRVAARVAVPFFLMTSGFFLLPGEAKPSCGQAPYVIKCNCRYVG